MHIPELLAPAGNLEKLKIAIQYGADAVYCAGKEFGLRAFAGNLSRRELESGISYAHEYDRRVYITVNIIPHNRDLKGLSGYLEFLAGTGADAIIVSDPGVISLAREVAPGLDLHLSTQANNTNWRSAAFWAEQGVKRINLARELSADEIAEICSAADVELETFVHGALCISYSGRCLLSSYLTGRDANRGECAQPCRWSYRVVEEERPGEYLPVEEDERGTYIFNSRDLCLLDQLPDLVKTGVNSLKIEGRMKSIHYVATVTRVYRQALDGLARDPDSFRVRREWRSELGKISHRGYTTGFFLGPPGNEGQRYEGSEYLRTHDFVGVVRDYIPGERRVELEVRNRVFRGDRIELFGPRTPPFEVELKSIRDLNTEMEIESAPHPHQLIDFPCPRPVERMGLARRRIGGGVNRREE